VPEHLPATRNVTENKGGFIGVPKATNYFSGILLPVLSYNFCCSARLQTNLNFCLADYSFCGKNTHLLNVSAEKLHRQQAHFLLLLFSRLQDLIVNSRMVKQRMLLSLRKI
jgi:hypothetical protein